MPTMFGMPQEVQTQLISAAQAAEKFATVNGDRLDNVTAAFRSTAWTIDTEATRTAQLARALLWTLLVSTLAVTAVELWKLITDD
jgi:hypothetical protein